MNENMKKCLIMQKIYIDYHVFFYIFLKKLENVHKTSLCGIILQLSDFHVVMLLVFQMTLYLASIIIIVLISTKPIKQP